MPNDHTDQPGPMTRLLEELVRTPEIDLTGTWSRLPGPGDRIGRFELVREIGAGGFGVVFEARDHDLGRPVAFKALRPSRALDAAHADALRQEAEAAARLNHQGIVTVHDFGTCDAGPFLIMELLRGESLAGRLSRGTLAPRETVRIALEVARALAHAHAGGVSHRDLNPGNVFLCDSGAVKVLDFGLARVLGSGSSGTPRGGTPLYAAPEQWRGEADDRADLFGLGCIVYRCLSGKTPYPAPTEETAGATEGPPPPALGGDVPARLATLARTLVAWRPEDRPATAEVVVRALEGLAAALEPAARRRRALAWSAAAIAAAGLVAAVSSRWWSHPPLDVRPLVAVADFENLTGEADLDALSGLLTTALEQSRHLAVMTRARLWDELGRLGRADATRIDEPLARQIGRRAGVRALLLASIRKLGDLYAIELRALDPKEDRYLFTLSERASSKEAVPRALDDLAVRARLALRDGQPDVDDALRPVGEAVTRSMEASRHYYAGVDCVARRFDSEQVCPIHFQRAIEVDPDFALAHHQLAYLMGAEGGDEAGARVENAKALLGASRAPPREQALILAYQDELDGRVDDAVARYRAAADRFPDDDEIVARAGYFLHRRREWVRALPFTRRAVALEPTHEDMPRLLVQELVQVGRLEELRDLAAAWSSQPPTPERRSLLVRVWTWLRAPGKALALARERAAAGGLAAHYDEAVLLFSRGEFGAARAALELDVAAHQADAYVKAGILRTLSAQGRLEESLRRTPVDDAPGRRALMRQVRAQIRVAQGNAAETWLEARACASADPAIAAALSADLLLLGDLPHARELAAGLAPGSLDERVWKALLRWRQGEGRAAVHDLKALAAAEPVASWWGMPPAYALAEVAFAEGDYAAVVDGADRLLHSWHPMSARGGGMVPRALLLRAIAEGRLGGVRQARAALQALLRERAGGDAGDPVAAEARRALAALPAS